MPDEFMSVDNAIATMRRMQAMQPNRSWQLAIRKFNPGGLTAHQTVGVKNMYAGIDWEAGHVILEPVRPLTELTSEEVADISKSVREGQSWHAYQIHKEHQARIKYLEAEVARLKAED